MRSLFVIIALFLVTDRIPARDLASVIRQIAAEPGFQEPGAEMGSRLAGRIREEYQQDESAILRDALAYQPTGEMDDSIFLHFWTDIGIGKESRVSLVETLVSSADQAEGGRAWQLLQLADRKIKSGTQQEIEVDLSGHASWLAGEENLPQEYLLYLFKHDGEQAWKLLGGSVESTPVLDGLAELVARNESSMLKVRSWGEEFRPRFQNEPLEKQKDLAYLAWAMGGIYYSEELALKNNPQIAAWMGRVLPGVGSTLMGGTMANMTGVKRTSAAEAATWSERMREKARLRPKAGSSSLAFDGERPAVDRRKAEQPGGDERPGVASGNSFRNWGLGAALLLLAVALWKFLQLKKAAQ